MRTGAKGVDVSHWKPIRDWGALAASGVTFVGMKATEGRTYVDDTLAGHVRGFRASSMLLGIYYHFARPGDPAAQAEHLVNTVARTGELCPHERLACDLEEGGPVEDKREIIGWLDMFFKTVHKRTGRFPLLYTSKRIWKSVGSPMTWELSPQVDLWVPRYARKEPENFGPWNVTPSEVEVWSHGTWEEGTAKLTKDKLSLAISYSKGANSITRPLTEEGTTWRRKTPVWTIWQTSDGKDPEPTRTPGIGSCDTNMFRGTEAQLKDYAASVCR